jgi:hypothetical protein
MTAGRATRQPGNPRARRRAALVAPVLAGLLIAAACGTTGPTGTPRSSGTPAVTGEPSGSGGFGGSGALPTPWLGNAVIGLEPLGVADGEIRQAMNDFNAGVQAGNVEQMRDATAGLAEVDVLLPNVDRIEPYPPMAEFAADYREAITRMAAAADDVRTAIEAGDGPGTTAASRELVESFTLYAAVQPQLAGWVVQIPEQKRILVR